jgi:hypothetical protein
MKLSLAGVVAAAALVKAVGFLFVALMNLLFRPYGGAYLALLTSIYPGYDPVSGPLSILLGTLYSLIAGAVAGLLFGWLYNFLADRF